MKENERNKGISKERRKKSEKGNNENDHREKNVKKKTKFILNNGNKKMQWKKEKEKHQSEKESGGREKGERERLSGSHNEAAMKQEVEEQWININIKGNRTNVNKRIWNRVENGELNRR